MRNKRFFIYFAVIFVGCNTLQGHRGMSEDIEESVRRGVFIWEYTVTSNPYSINDSLILEVESAWLEKRWAYPSNTNETLIGNGYQLILRVSNNITNYARTWMIGVDERLYLRRCGPSCLMMDCDSIPGEKILWKVQEGIRIDSLSKKNAIGEFVLIKKQ